MFRKSVISLIVAAVVTSTVLALSPLVGGQAGASTVSTWQTTACGQVQSVTAPAGANSVTIVTTGASGGNGGKGDSSTGSGGQGGSGSKQTVSYGIHAGQQLSAEAGCGGGAGSGSAPGTGGAGWSTGGTGGAGYSCFALSILGYCIFSGQAYGGAGGGGGASAVCLGPTCTSTSHPAVVAGGGGGGGESIYCSNAGGNGGNGGGGTVTTSTDSTGTGPSGSAGLDGDNDSLVSPGGVNSVGGPANGAQGTSGNGQILIGILYHSAGAGGGGAGYVGGQSASRSDGYHPDGGGGGSSYTFTNPSMNQSSGTASAGNGTVTITFKTDVLPIPSIATTPPASPPGAPVVGTVTPGNGTALVTWTVPANGGDPITGFVITPYDNGVAQTPIDVPAGPVGSATDPTPGAHDSYLVTGLTNGDTYTFTVQAVSAEGTGPASSPTSPVTPTATTPGAPVVGPVTPGNGSVLVTWTVPANGGDPITGFIITPYDNGVAQTPIDVPAGPVGSATDPTPGAHDSYLVTGLKDGDTYTFTVQAVSAAGTGPASSPTSPTTPVATVPGTPVVGPSTPGNGSVLVTWTVPANGGDPITGFIITPYDNGVAQTPIDVPAGPVGSALDPTPGAQDSYLVTGLTNGDTYTFTVQAVSAAGSGSPSSPTTPATPVATVPGTPVVGPTTPGNGSVLVTWTVPANGGDPITGFIITPYDNGVAQTPIVVGAGPVGSPLDPTPGAQDSYLVTGLTYGDTYTFTVAAMSAAGTGPASSPTAPTTPNPNAPGTPVVGPVTPGNASALVTWTVPANGGSPITGFIITPFANGIAQTPIDLTAGPVGSALDPTPGAHDSYLVTGLINGDTYSFTVTAVNGAGSGTASPPTTPVIPSVPTPPSSPGGGIGAKGQGYWTDASDGGIFTFGALQFYGSMGGTPLNKPIVGMTATADDKGYWLVASDGGIFAFGDAQFYGSMGGQHLNQPIVGMTATADGKGYWLVAADGGVFAYGDARFFGSTGNLTLNKPIVGMTATADGKGYWMVASDGGIFAYGSAAFHGSMGGHHLNQPIVGMTSTADGQGYWMVAADGGIFSFGDAPFFGSAGNLQLVKPIVGMTATPDGKGYWMDASDGGIFAYGDAAFHGSMGGQRLNKPMVGMTI